MPLPVNRVNGQTIDPADINAIAAAVNNLPTSAEFLEAVQDAVAAMLVEGTGVDFAYNDSTGKLTVSAAQEIITNPDTPSSSPYLDMLKGIGGLTHHYELASNANDTVGSINGTTSGVTFSGGKAIFNGAAHITLSDSNDFSLAAQANGLTIVAYQTVDNWAGVDPEDSGAADPYIHWMGKGQSGGHEWVLRHYTAAASTRAKRTSLYHFNASGGQGAGSYFQDDDATGVERIIVGTFDKTTTTGVAGASASFPGAAFLYKNGALRDSDGFGGDYNITPANTSTPVLIGCRETGASHMIGKIRRVSFFNKKLTLAQVQTIYNNRALA